MSASTAESILKPKTFSWPFRKDRYRRHGYKCRTKNCRSVARLDDALRHLLCPGHCGQTHGRKEFRRRRGHTLRYHLCRLHRHQSPPHRRHGRQRRIGPSCGSILLKTTRYFQATRSRPDRRGIRDEWIEFVISCLEKEYIQADGRIRRWARIKEMNNRYLRVVLLQDGVTVHNAFFDRGYTP